MTEKLHKSYQPVIPCHLKPKKFKNLRNSLECFFLPSSHHRPEEKKKKKDWQKAKLKEENAIVHNQKRTQSCTFLALTARFPSPRKGKCEKSCVHLFKDLEKILKMKPEGLTPSGGPSFGQQLITFCSDSPLV